LLAVREKKKQLKSGIIQKLVSGMLAESYF
jgi:hypothetical protein